MNIILGDAHLMDMANLRKLRLLFEDFPKNHNPVLLGRPNLLAALDLGVTAGDLGAGRPKELPGRFYHGKASWSYNLYLH
jgi:hypothetical protein